MEVATEYDDVKLFTTARITSKTRARTLGRLSASWPITRKQSRKENNWPTLSIRMRENVHEGEGWLHSAVAQRVFIHNEGWRCGCVDKGQRYIAHCAWVDVERD